MMKISLKYIILLLVILFIETCSCVSDGSLFAIGKPLQILKYDLDNGTLIPFGPIYDDYASFQGLATTDSVNKVIYVLDYDLTKTKICILALSMGNGKLIKSIETPLYSDGHGASGQTIDVNPHTGDIYIAGHIKNQDQYKHAMFKITFQDWKFSEIADLTYWDTIAGFHLFDTCNEFLWFDVGINDTHIMHYYGLDVSTGKVRYDYINDDLVMNVLANDPSHDEMYGCMFNKNKTAPGFHFARFMIKDNKPSIEIIAELPVLRLIYGNVGTIDYKKRIFYSMFKKDTYPTSPVYLIGIDIETGNIILDLDVGLEENIPLDIVYGSPYKESTV